MNQWTKNPVSLLERFNQKWQPVTESGCWIWTGSASRYGAIRVNRKMRAAHQISYEMHVGTIPPNLVVCHRCDVACCVNPAHLFLATQKDNCDDRDRKGRNVNRVGEAHGCSKLTEAAVRYIRSSCKTQCELAKELQVTPHTVRLIKKHRTWKHVS